MTFTEIANSTTLFFVLALIALGLSFNINKPRKK